MTTITLFTNIKSFADKQGIGLGKLAIKAGLSENAIYSWKSKSPKLENVEAVAKALHVTVAQLTGEDDTEPTGNTVVDLASEGVFMFDGDDVSEDEMAMIRGMLDAARAAKKKKGSK